MSDRCSCEPGTMNYRCSRGRPCDVHGAVDALMAWGEYWDRRGRKWIRLNFGGECYEWQPEAAHYANPLGPGLDTDQMRLRIVREQHREVCPGLRGCRDHAAPKVLSWRGHWWLEDGWETTPFPTFAEAIDAAQQLAKETT